MAEIKPIHEIIKDISSYHKKEGPLAEHKLVYDSSTETLEPVYFFVLDLMEDFGLSPKKLVDNFSSSPGSGHFAELNQRATIMQQQGSKILGDVNTVLRSVLNIIYDLKEFKIRLSAYDDLKSRDKNITEAAVLSLKQLWMDKVDYPSKGNSSIKAMALGQAGFQTLIDAFLVAKDTKQAKELDLNERVKRIVISRIEEFNSWLIQSEKELRKRYGLERTYLKSQVNSLKLYSRWARPYLVAASRLQSRDLGNDPNLVNVFNTLILELTLLGKQPIKVRELALEGELPRDFINESVLKSLKRNYNVCILVDFRFRGIPQRVIQQSHFAFGGKSEITFRAYALNDDELAKLDQEMEKSDIASTLSLVEGSSGESLSQLQEEIDYFLEDKEPGEKKSGNSDSDSSNPFLAIIGYYDKSDKPKVKEDKNKEIEVKNDSWIEKNHLRKLAADKSKDMAFTLFEIYKKAHGMPAYT